MQKQQCYLILMFLTSLLFSSNSQIINIPDTNFKAELIKQLDFNLDGEIQQSEALSLFYLDVKDKSISSLIGIKAFTNLEYLDCSVNLLSELDVAGMNHLNELNCAENSISILNISGLVFLTVLNCSENWLTSIDLSALPNLENLDCVGNQITTLNLSGLIKLITLRCATNSLTSLDISKLIKLEELYCASNEFSDLNVSNLVNLKSISSCCGGHLSSLNVSGCLQLQEIYCSENKLLNLDLSGLTKLQRLWCSKNSLTKLEVTNLISLQELVCDRNLITNLDVSGLTNLEQIKCHSNIISNLNLSGLIKLTYLSCGGNKLTSLDISNSINLQTLDYSGNNISSLDLSELKNLQELYCENNKITNLEVTKLTKLTDLYCGYNLIDSLDASNLIHLRHFNCNNNQLKILDVSGAIYLQNLLCHDNQLQSLFIKNGMKEFQLAFSNNPLQYICCDENQLADVQNQVTQYGMTSCNVNSYCPYKAGGAAFKILGQNKLDIDNNGCDSLDDIIPFLKIKITGGSNEGSIITDASGHYAIRLQAGIYSLTPIIESPNLFSANPNTLQVNFPNNTSPFIQDFCISPIGTHPDVEIKILSLTSARPGFDAQYKILVRNKGNLRVSGKIQFDYHKDLMNLVNTSVPPFNQNPGSLVWDFANLNPFQTKSIIITMNINTPAAIPPVNAGDVLNFSASITLNVMDELPLDNLFELYQTVVGSKDPNDKTCLQGKFIASSSIGEYMDYLIRFENTGSAEAINIVVKDIIDTSKFDISSLIPLDASHLFRTIISNGNKVEFIFENINLPFSGSERSGYIAFKIRSKTNLKIGDNLKNTANIYFDYNLPILTNQTETNIKLNVKTGNEVNSNLKISILPNPASNFIQIQSSETIHSLEIFDANSRLVEAYISPVEKLDISKLKAGCYWLLVHTPSGISLKELLKNK